MTLEGLQEKAAGAGFWLRYSSPFTPDDQHRVRLYPHGSTGRFGETPVRFGGVDLKAAIGAASEWLDEGRRGNRKAGT